LVPSTPSLLIQTTRDERIVATAPRIEIVQGGLGVIELERPAADVEGFVTVDGAVATGVRIHFRYNEGKYE
jgi:hypothetical protein